jgi:catechol-2,3-dioxygenase
MQKFNSSIFFIVLLLCSFHVIKAQEQTKNTVMKHQQKNGGIVFLATQKLDSVTRFYTEKIGCELWLDQGACQILQHGNMLFGFCNSDRVDKEGVITFFYPSKEKVDKMYELLNEIALEKPKMNPKFRIYHFYATDPEGRSIEFQYFDHELKAY